MVRVKGRRRFILKLSDVPSDIRGVARYCDKLDILVLPAESGLVK